MMRVSQSKKLLMMGVILAIGPIGSITAAPQTQTRSLSDLAFSVAFIGAAYLAYKACSTISSWIGSRNQEQDRNRNQEQNRNMSVDIIVGPNSNSQGYGVSVRREANQQGFSYSYDGECWQSCNNGSAITFMRNGCNYCIRAGSQSSSSVSGNNSGNSMPRVLRQAGGDTGAIQNMNMNMNINSNSAGHQFQQLLQAQAGGDGRATQNMNINSADCYQSVGCTIL